MCHLTVFWPGLSRSGQLVRWCGAFALLHAPAQCPVQNASACEQHRHCVHKTLEHTAGISQSILHPGSSGPLLRKCAASSCQLNIIQVLMRKKGKGLRKSQKYMMIDLLRFYTIRLNSCLSHVYFNLGDPHAAAVLVRRVWQTNNTASFKSDQLCSVDGHNSEILLIYAKKRKRSLNIEMNREGN